MKKVKTNEEIYHTFMRAAEELTARQIMKPGYAKQVSVMGKSMRKTIYVDQAKKAVIA